MKLRQVFRRSAGALGLLEFSFEQNCLFELGYSAGVLQLAEVVAREMRGPFECA
jgi:hypothetical protein